MKITALCLLGVLLTCGIASAETAEMSSVVPPPSSAASASDDFETFFLSLGETALAGNSLQCTNGTCNAPKDCFLQGWNRICDSGATGTAAWCWGYPGVTGCEGECGCM